MAGVPSTSQYAVALEALPAILAQALPRMSHDTRVLVRWFECWRR